jgi:hypothetical protein
MTFEYTFQQIKIRIQKALVLLYFLIKFIHNTTTTKKKQISDILQKATAFNYNLFFCFFYPIDLEYKKDKYTQQMLTELINYIKREYHYQLHIILVDICFRTIAFMIKIT